MSTNTNSIKHNSNRQEFIMSETLMVEQSLLGGLLLSNTHWDSVHKILCTEDFSIPQHALLFKAIEHLEGKKVRADVVTVGDYLESIDEMANAGGYAYLAPIVTNTPSAANVVAYANIVKRRSMERMRERCIEAGNHHKAAAITAAIDSLEVPKATMIGIEELCSLPPSENWVVRDYIPQDGLGVLFADPEAGKSFLLIDMACHIACGKPWRGKPVKEGVVVYIAGEGRNGLSKRFKAWFEKHHETPRNILLRTTTIALTKRVEVSELVREVQRYPGKVRLVIVDTINRNFGDGDENDTRDMTMAVAGLDALRLGIGATVFGAHHCGQAEKKRARGSSVLKASLDFEYSLERFGDTVQLRCTKAKDFNHPVPLAWTMQNQSLPWCDCDGVPINSAVMVPRLDIPVSDDPPQPSEYSERNPPPPPEMDYVPPRTLTVEAVSTRKKVPPSAEAAPLEHDDTLAYSILQTQGPLSESEWRKRFYTSLSSREKGLSASVLWRRFTVAESSLRSNKLVLVENDFCRTPSQKVKEKR